MSIEDQLDLSSIPTEGRPLRVGFVSDLHLFARRSRADRHQAAIRQAASRADLFVLGGDIFDFKWTTLATMDETAQAAAAWLRELIDSTPGCRFHYLLGNHDHHESFLGPLDDLARSANNLAWHPYYLRLGSAIFLHGDAVDAPGGPAPLAQARERWSRIGKQGPWPNRAYAVLLHSGAYHLILRANSHRRVAGRILSYLERIEQGPAQGVETVYFGHTHRAMSAYRHGGLVFHNGGAPLRGLRFGVIEATVS